MYEHRDDIQPGSERSGDGTARRLRWALLAAVAVVLLAAIPGIALNSGDNTKKVTSGQASPPVSTTTTVGVGVVAGVPMAASPALPTTTVAAGNVTPLQTGTTLPHPAPTTTAAPPAPAPAKPCRNSYDPACGPFRWDPSPDPNQPLTVTFSAPSQQVAAGTEVNFHIVAHDPDAKVDRCIFFVDFGDGQKGGNCPPPPSCQTPYGPWTPPAKVDDTYTFDLKHTYTAPSPPNKPYQVSVVMQSHSFCNPDPYGGSGQAPAQVTVS